MFLTVYQREPHARQMSFKDIKQPTTYAERCALAKRTNRELGLVGTLVIDSMNDTSRAFFGDLPTPAIVIGPDGHVKVKLPWAEPDVLAGRLKAAMAEKRAKPTSPRGELVDALRTHYEGGDAKARFAAMVKKWVGPANLRPIAFRAHAACVKTQDAVDAAVVAAKRVFDKPRLDAALAEIEAIGK